MNIIQAIESDKVFKPLFRDLRSWRAWLVFLKALFALPMERDERRLFKKCTGLKKAPAMQARESYVIAGRRSGKSFISAVVSVFLALFHDWKPFLATGEKELIKLMNEINIFGYDLVTALRNIAFNSPSNRLTELFNGLATTITSGGNLPEFFDMRSRSLLFEYRL